MLYIVTATILLIIGLIGLLVRAGSDPDDKDSAAGFGVGLATFGFASLIVWTIVMSATTVSPRAVGIQTAFGRYQSTLPAGFHWTAPWSNVEEFSTQIQPLDSTTSVAYKGGGKGAVNSTIRWRIDQDNAQKLWQKYRTFDNVRDNLVASGGRDSVRVVVGPYTPNAARAGENLRPITDGVTSDLARTLADDGALIDSVSITDVQVDEATQRSLEGILKAQNDVEKAKADEQRALVDARTAKIRATSGSLSASALQRYCLEVTNAWSAANNGPLPATWNCLGGSQSPVIVGGR